MSLLNQKTIKNSVSFTGVGLHSGKLVNINIKPSDPDTGIVFKRIDLKNDNLVYPNFMNVSNTALNTTIINNSIVGNSFISLKNFSDFSFASFSNLFLKKLRYK